MEHKVKPRGIIKRELPPIGTILIGSYHQKKYTAQISLSKKDNKKKIVLINNQEFISMSAAAVSITGHQTNGWIFWHFA